KLSQHALRRLGAALDGFGQHLDCETRTGWHDNSGSKLAALYPGLTGFRNTITANVGQAEPSFLLYACGQLLECFSRACGHSVVLARNQVNIRLVRGREAQPC